MPNKAGIKLKQARQELGFTQKKLAGMIGCTSSALCMFEKGKHDALSVERLKTACEALNLEPGALLEKTGARYCSNPFCPTHYPFRIGDAIALKPEPVDGDSAARCCGWCGELLVSKCEACDTAYDGESAFCQGCGQAYVDLPEGYHVDEKVLGELQLLRVERAAFTDLREGGQHDKSTQPSRQP